MTPIILEALQERESTPTKHDSLIVLEDRRGQMEDDAHNRREYYDTPIPIPKHVPKVCQVLFALILDAMAVTTANFFAAIKADICLNATNIVWSKASTKGESLIVLPIDDKNNLCIFCKKINVGSKFIANSWVSKSIMEMVQEVSPSKGLPGQSDQNPVAMGPLKEWYSTPSTLVGGKKVQPCSRPYLPRTLRWTLACQPCALLGRDSPSG
jgi:hypothetical protein